MTTTTEHEKQQEEAGSLNGLDRIAPTMRDAVRRYVEMVREDLGPSFSSLTMFGGALDSRFNPRSATAESVLVVQRVKPELLRRLANHGPKLGRLGIAAPLVMTGAYIRSSLDAFPLEMIEIQQRYVTVAGQDEFAELTFEAAHIRLQCERELKRVLAGLSHGLLASTGMEKAVAPLEREAGLILLRTLRGLLWLDGQKEFVDDPDVVQRIETKCKRKFPGVRSAIDPLTDLHWRDFDELYQDVQVLGESANAW